ncbi:MAG TPA: DUF1840 domain-containing protein [Burkholderiales bacterium]|nr:DUF1840 domain-containing protein [Burkholderiales bacterium]
MIVRFRSDAGSLIMFGDIAVTLLRMMGQSGVLPGALAAEDVPAALERLKRAVAAQEEKPVGARQEEEGTAGPRVSLRQRAFPLIELLERAAKKECGVVWEEERPLFQRKAPA